MTFSKAIEALRAKKKAERAEKLKEEERLAEKKANEKLVENYRQKKAEKIAEEKRKKKDIELEEQRIKPGIYIIIVLFIEVRNNLNSKTGYIILTDISACILLEKDEEAALRRMEAAKARTKWTKSRVRQADAGMSWIKSFSAEFKTFKYFLKKNRKSKKLNVKKNLKNQWLLVSYFRKLAFGCS